VTRVKICGLRELDHARAALDSGADMLGFVFAPSRRQVEPDDVKVIIATLRPEKTFAAVGVFVDAVPDEMNRLADYCDLDYIQLSGDEPDSIVRELRRPVIRTIHVGSNRENLAARLAAAPGEIILLDTARLGTWGGTGETFDWTLIPRLARPALLAGGLHHGNVAAAIDLVQPWGVDVSSGVETAGRKDAARIRAFLTAVRGVPQ